MAIIFQEGFDKYGGIGTIDNSITTTRIYSGGEWNNFVGKIVAPLSATGFAFLGSANRSLTANYTRIIGGIRFNANLSQPQMGYEFVTGNFSISGNNCCSIRIEQVSGRISIMSGGVADGIVLATSTASVSSDTINYLEWDISFGPGTPYQIWLNGQSILVGTSTNILNGATFINTFAMGFGNSGNVISDDLYLFDATGTTNNAVLLTNPRIETTWPISDSQTQFTNGASIIGAGTAGGDQFFTGAIVANTLFLRRYSQGSNVTVNSISVLPQSTIALAVAKPAIYSDLAGAPNALLSTGPEVVGVITGTVLTATLNTPQALTAGTFYWIGFIVSGGTWQIEKSDANRLGYSASSTYASGPPGTAPTMTPNGDSWQLWGNCTGSAVNWVSEDLNAAVGDYSYILSNLVNTEDLYGFTALSEIPANIYNVSVKALVRKTDTGTRTADLQMKSSGTDSPGTTINNVPGTAYTWIESNYETDPHTGLPWTKTTLDAAVSGVKVAS